MKNKKGFTLIELLAVIIILGVLMLIAIPSITEYITNSRKSTFLSSAANFISAVTIKTNAGADGGFNLSDNSVYYAIPVSNDEASSCINLEKGGKSPFGTWKHGTNDGWAYVIVALNDTATAYTYWFTAIDSGGYGISPARESEPAQWNKDQVRPNASTVSGTYKAVVNPKTISGPWTPEGTGAVGTTYPNRPVLVMPAKNAATNPCQVPSL